MNILIGKQIIQYLKYLTKEMAIICQQHELRNEQDYPNNLNQNEIPIWVKVIPVADASDV